jgi:hypothetical protein
MYLLAVRDDVATGTGDTQPAAQQPERLTARVFPNPFERTAVLALEPRMALQRWRVAVYDVAGRMVRRQTVTNAWQVPLQRGELAAGTYFYRIDAGAGARAAGKFTVRDASPR